MSIKIKILLPLLGAITLGLALSAGMAWQITNETAYLERTIDKALITQSASRETEEHFLGMSELLSRVSGMTTMIMPDEIEAQFQTESVPLAAAIVDLRANALSPGMADLADRLQSRHDSWLHDAKIVLGMAQASEIPTGEVMSAHMGALGDMIVDLAVLTENATRTSMQAESAAIVEVTILTLAIGLALAVFGAAGSYWLAQSLSRPLVDLVTSAEALAHGDTTVAFPAETRSDEIGMVSRAIAGFRDGVLEQARLEEQSKSQHAQQATRQQRIESLISGFQTQAISVLGSVEQKMAHMSETAVSLKALADDTSMQGQAASQASSGTASNVSSVASATEELSGSVNEIARTVSAASDLIAKATDNTRQSNEKVSELAGAADKIGAVVQLIQDIAEQTNLLALNATIEAARAGEAGKGFAVVASEVKALATQTARATEEISGQISTIQKSTQDSVEAIHTISSTMDEVNGAAQAIAASIDEQGRATHEINQNVAEVTNGSRIVDESIEAVARAVDATSKSANEVNKVADEAARETADLKRAVEEFLREVSAA